MKRGGGGQEEQMATVAVRMCRQAEVAMDLDESLQVKPVAPRALACARSSREFTPYMRNSSPAARTASASARVILPTVILQLGQKTSKPASLHCAIHFSATQGSSEGMEVSQTARYLGYFALKSFSALYLKEDTTMFFSVRPAALTAASKMSAYCGEYPLISA